MSVTDQSLWCEQWCDRKWVSLAKLKTVMDDMQKRSAAAVDVPVQKYTDVRVSTNDSKDKKVVVPWSSGRERD